MFLKKYTLALSSLLAVISFTSGCLSPRLPDSVQVAKNIEYAHIGSKALRLDIYSPKTNSGKLPVVVWLHAGGWRYGSKNVCPIRDMASQNFAIVSVDYRLSGSALFPAQLYDCKSVVRWLRANADKYHLDSDHIGIYGASSGGHLAALLGTTAGNPKLEGDVGGNLNFSSSVQAVCALYPPTDLRLLITGPSAHFFSKWLVSKLLGGDLNENLDKESLASPLRFVSQDSAPCFLLHGEKDSLVPLQQSKLFYDALKKEGVEAHFVTVPGKGHGFMAPPDVAQQIARFLEQQLKPGMP